MNIWVLLILLLFWSILLLTMSSFYGRIWGFLAGSSLTLFVLGFQIPEQNRAYFWLIAGVLLILAIVFIVLDFRSTKKKFQSEESQKEHPQLILPENKKAKK